MNKSVARNIVDYMEEKIKPLKDPRVTGKGLSFNKSGLWRYRIGDYRAICQINDEKIIIMVLEVGHRKEIYDTSN